MKSRRILTSIIFLFFLITVTASPINAQKCGFSRVVFTLTSESTGKPVPKATIEIIARYGGNFKEFSENDLGKVMINQPGLKIPEQTVNQVIKESKPLDIQTDYCGHSLKKTKGKNVVKGLFGFCASEVDDRYYLLKISTPNYLTTYYVGAFLGGCERSRKFVIPKARKS